MSSVIITALLLPFAVVAVALWFRLLVVSRNLWYMLWTGTNERATDPGMRAISGPVRPVEETVQGPFTGTEAILCEGEFKRWTGSTEGHNYERIDRQERSVPFEVVTPDGPVRVDAADAEWTLSAELELDSAPGEDLPAHTQQYVETSDEVDMPEVRENRYLFIEKRLDPGSEVYVLGTVDTDPTTGVAGSSGHATIAREERGWLARQVAPPFVVSDSGVDSARWRQFKMWLLSLGIAVPTTAIVLLFGVVWSGV